MGSRRRLHEHGVDACRTAATRYAAVARTRVLPHSRSGIASGLFRRTTRQCARALAHSERRGNTKMWPALRDFVADFTDVVGKSHGAGRPRRRPWRAVRHRRSCPSPVSSPSAFSSAGRVRLGDDRLASHATESAVRVGRCRTRSGAVGGVSAQ